MYIVRYNGDVLHDARTDSLRATEARCMLSGNIAGEMTVGVPPGHPLYGTFTAMDCTCEITLEEDGEELFRGRIRSIATDVHGVQRLVCEDQLAYLNDSILRPYGTYESDDWDSVAPRRKRELWEWYIARHNDQVGAEKRFHIGRNEVGSGMVTRSSTQYPTTGSEIKAKLVDHRFGYVRAYMSDGLRYIDFLDEGGPRNGQRIEFGVNLTDFAGDLTTDSLITAIIPIGSDGLKLDGSVYGPLGDCHVIGDMVVSDPGSLKRGIIAEQRTYDAATQKGLALAAVEDLESGYKPISSLTIKAVDLHKVDPDISPIRLYDWVRVTARPYGIDQWMMCVEMTIDVADPAQCEYTFGSTVPTLSNSIAVRQRDLEIALEEGIYGVAEDVGEAREIAEEAREIAEEAREVAGHAGDSSEAKAAAEAASRDAKAAKDAAEAASRDADAAKSAVAPILEEYDAVRDEAQAAAREVAEIRDSMESTYAKKTELTETEAVLLTYIEQSSAAYMIAAAMEVTGRPAATEAAGSALATAESALDSAASNLAAARRMLMDASDELDAAEDAYKRAQAEGDAEAIAQAESDIADARAALSKAEADCAEAQKAFMKAEQGFIDKYNAALTVQADMIRAQVSKTEQIGDTVTEMQSDIEMTAEAIAAEVTAREQGDSALSSRITQNASAIESEVEAREGADSALSSRITQNAAAITAEVTARENGDTALGTRITQTAESITSTVEGIDGRLSEVEQTADGITVRLDSGEFDGRGISSVQTQYYLSTSQYSQTGGSWSDTPAAYVSGRYYWERDKITYTDSTTGYSTAVLSRGLNSANATAASASSTANSASAAASNAQTAAGNAQTAADNAASAASNAQTTANSAATAAGNAQTTANSAATAAANAARTATDYLTYSSSGLDVGYSSTGGKTRITSKGMEIYKGSTKTASFTDTEIQLGMNSQSSVVKFCGSEAQIGYDSSKLGAYMVGNGKASLASDSSLGYYIGMDDDKLVIQADNVYFSTAEPRYVEMSLDDMVLAIKPDVLFSGSTNGTVALSKSASSYGHMRIFFRDVDSHYASVDIDSPVGKAAFLVSGRLSGSTWQREFKLVSIYASSITSGDTGFVNTIVGTGAGYSANSSDNNIYITRVEAW